MADPKDMARHFAALRKAEAANDLGAVEIIRGRIMDAQKGVAGQSGLEGMTTDQQAAAGIGHGMIRSAMNLKDIGQKFSDLPSGGGLLGLVQAAPRLTGALSRATGGRIPDPLRAPSKEEWLEFEETSRPLMETTPGKVGSFVGEVAATAPVGGLVGGGVKSLAGAGARVLPRVAGALSRPVGQAMTQGAAIGGLQGGPEGRLTGAALGAAGGGLLHGAGRLAGKAARGLVEATPAAKYLGSKGVNLTLGTSRPGTNVGYIEEAGQSLGGIGPTLTAQRAAAKGSWQDAVLSEVMPKGGKITGVGISEKLGSAYKAFDAAYEPIRKAVVYPVIHGARGGGLPLQGSQGAFRRAVLDPEALATNETRQMVDRFLQNQLSLLPKQKGAMPRVQAGDLLRIRSNIRTKMRQMLGGKDPDYETARLLENAERSVTKSLESQLPNENIALLRAVDQKYAQYKTVEDAVRKAGDSIDGFTPAQLSNAVKQATEGGSYARGAGGELRKLAAAGRETFDVRTPPTAARALATSWPIGYATGPAVAVGNLPGPKALLTGQTAAQRQTQAIINALRSKLGPRGVSALKTGGIAGAATLMNQE
jgi:hypothetical protein